MKKQLFLDTESCASTSNSSHWKWPLCSICRAALYQRAFTYRKQEILSLSQPSQSQFHSCIKRNSWRKEVTLTEIPDLFFWVLVTAPGYWDILLFISTASLFACTHTCPGKCDKYPKSVKKMKNEDVNLICLCDNTFKRHSSSKLIHNRQLQTHLKV